MRPQNTKDLFEFLTGQMERLSKKEITVDEARTQCQLAGQVINVLNYELKRALIAGRAKVLEIETGRGKVIEQPDGSSAEVVEEETPPAVTTTFTVPEEAEPALSNLITESDGTPIEYKLITLEENQWFAVLFPLVDGGDCTMVEYKAPTRQHALDHARERFGKPRLKSVTNAEYVNERGYHKLRIMEKIDLTIKPIYAYKL